MNIPLPAVFLFAFVLLVAPAASATISATAQPSQSEELVALDLRCEYLTAPEGIDVTVPRLSWRVASARRAVSQSAWQIIVASSPERLARDAGDLWDSGKSRGNATNQILYAGIPLQSRQRCYWKVRVWDETDTASAWSAASVWSMGLLAPSDWSARWISHRDTVPLPVDRTRLHLPPAQYYRHELLIEKPVRRATLYASALGLYEFHCNGERVGDALLQPGWSDYALRAYYRTHDVTGLLRRGKNAIGAIVADGWYSGYVGYGLLVGYGPHRTGRNFYGKTPALLAQLEIEYADGSRAVVGTGADWLTSSAGPIREADIIMGETYDARAEWASWNLPGFDAHTWERAIRAEDNGPCKTSFSDNTGTRLVDLGFRQPLRLQAYSAPVIRVTQELPVLRWSEPKPGIYIADFGRNFAGVVRLRVRGKAGDVIRLRYGEMLNSDGSLMTENLRKARASDTYTLRGDPLGEVWTPRFTYHGFQYAEIAGLSAQPASDTLVGLVLHNDAQPTGSFACSDDVMTRFAVNAQWTQRANFVEVPTDCPQRDERLGWMGDAQAYIRTATFNADLGAFFTKWLDDVVESQRSFGAFPDYAPYPMGHGTQGKTFGTAWTDAGVICPWTIWKVYGDTRLPERFWPALTRFMEWRQSATAVDGGGTSLGNPWGDWLNVDDTTTIEYVDTCYHALVCGQMAEMADAIGRPVEAKAYRDRRALISKAFAKRYLGADGRLKERSQSAHVLALQCGVLEKGVRGKIAQSLAESIAAAGYRMTTGFLGTRALLIVLSENGQHDLAARLFQSRTYPSWGYEVVNGATSVWERWDSYTVEHGFNGKDGKQNAAMNSFSHYAFGAVMEWAYRHLAGIDTKATGYRHLVLRPLPPSAGSNPEGKPITWAKASYRSINGPIESAWKNESGRFEYDVVIPANTTATVILPKEGAGDVREGGQPVALARGVLSVKNADDNTIVEIGSGAYHFEVK